ncbi:metallophosphoesterase [Clostridium estertheticum]|uniref:Metallophosphoesterase n=1 Tax=Clostridium estertheticum TaxID=238834 RepID=A0AA47EEP2_9CLOT|nr:metallophosphoesterase [Clostridium estertheticum]MBU3155013.1 metallophosphoesterase [Clostridium estertheticum]WAG58831.1 metallophosphoesterase [Clostridium estertheticum]
MSAFRALHLSDVHIGKTYIDSKEIAYRIVSSLENNGLCSIKCVLVTGDIFDGQVVVEESLIKEAVLFFKKLLEQINIVQTDQKLNESDFIFVPGNHDMIRTDKYECRWKKYNDFLTGFYGIIPDFYDIEDYTVVRPYKDSRIVFAGFNSCQIEKKVIVDKKSIERIKNIDSKKMDDLGINKANLINLLQDEINSKYEDYGEIPTSQTTNVRRRVKKFDGYNVIALFHHHFYLFPEVVQEYGDSSLVRNYANLIQELKYMNVKTVLHGHKHFDLERPLITEDYYQTTDSIIDVFAGGSVGAKIVDRHTFSVIDFYDEKEDVKLVQNKFIYSGEHLEPIVKKQIPPKNISDRKIMLIEILKTNNYDIYLKYIETTDKMNKTYRTCKEINNWTSEALTGFKDVYKFLDSDYKNILFLLYAIDYRTLSYKNIIEGETQNLQSYFDLLKEFFDHHLNSCDFDVDINDFHEVFKIKELGLLKEKCDELINMSTNKMTKQYLAFSMVGIFFTDLYLVLTEYADDFYEQNIKYKVNIKLDQNKFHQYVPVPRIEIKSDSDRRSVYIQLLCNEATAHKIAVLFVKEFDLLINKFEDYFKLIGLKIYYLLPKIEKSNFKDTIDNYNFEAYIPTLLPLLTGRNIYPLKEVFARELIQNSIDAIAVREAKGESNFSKIINIEIGEDEKDRSFFKIKDCGTGMDRFKIERYFTSIGRSFYSGDEYDELNINYKPISNFGIGFLSSFMVCKEIDVKTKSFMIGSEGLKIHIPNYEGCFFIEHEDDVNVGTEIKLYLNEGVEGTKIVQYIEKVMLDVKYDIHIKYSNENVEQTKIISAYSIREKSKKKFNFFVPFKENGDVLISNWNEGVDIEKYEYGLLIKPIKRSDIQSQSVLNSGILIGESSLSDIFQTKDDRPRFNEGGYNSIFANFPSNWIQLDVSREKSTSFANIIKEYNDKNPESTVQNKIAITLYKQLLNCFEYGKENEISNSASCIQEIIKYAKSLSCNKKSKLSGDLSDIHYVAFAKITTDGIEYIVDHFNKNHEDTYHFKIEGTLNIINELKKRNFKAYNIFKSHKQDIIFDDASSTHRFGPNFSRFFQESSMRRRFGLNITKEFYKYYFDRQSLSVEKTTTNIISILTLSLMDIFENDLESDHSSIDFYHMVSLITNILLENMSVSDIESGNNKINIRISDIDSLIKQLKDNKNKKLELTVNDSK